MKKLTRILVPVDGSEGSERAAELAADFGTEVIGTLDRSEDIPLAEERGKTIVASAPDSDTAKQLEAIADSVYAACGGE